MEDTAVAIGNNAVVNRVGADSRRVEVEMIEKTIEKNLLQLGFNETDTRRLAGATCDRGDV